MGQSGGVAVPQRSASQAQEVERRIRERAYELLLERIESGEPADELLDWLAAEAEVLAAGPSLGH